MSSIKWEMDGVARRINATHPEEAKRVIALSTVVIDTMVANEALERYIDAARWKDSATRMLAKAKATYTAEYLTGEE